MAFKPIDSEKISLTDTHEEMISQAVDRLKNDGVVSYIAPPRSKKTFVAFEIIRRLEVGKVLFQTNRTLLNHQQMESFEKVFKNEGWVVRRADSAQVWDKEETELALKNNDKVIVFAVDKSVRHLEDLHFDLGIYDEAHHSVQNRMSVMPSVLFHTMDIDMKLFLTATPRYSRDSDDYSMDDTGFYGEQVVLPHAQAVEEDIISDYKIWISYLEEETIPDRIISRNYSGLVDSNTGKMHVSHAAIIKGVEEASKKHNHILLFAESVEVSKAYVDCLNDLGIYSKHVDADSPESYRDEVKHQFKESGKAMVLSNYGIFGEGITLDADAVVFGRIPKSRVAIVQMAGRVWNAGKTGHVIMPIISSNDVGQRNQEIDNIAHLLHGLMEVDKPLADIVDKMIVSNNPRTVLQSQTKLNISNLDRLTSDTYLKSLFAVIKEYDKLIDWDSRLSEIKSWCEKHDHLPSGKSTNPFEKKMHVWLLNTTRLSNSTARDEFANKFYTKRVFTTLTKAMQDLDDLGYFSTRSSTTLWNMLNNDSSIRTKPKGKVGMRLFKNKMFLAWLNDRENEIGVKPALVDKALESLVDWENWNKGKRAAFNAGHTFPYISGEVKSQQKKLLYEDNMMFMQIVKEKTDPNYRSTISVEKLSKEQVLEIRKKHKVDKISMNKIAQDFDVSVWTIYRIIRDETYKWVE